MAKTVENTYTDEMVAELIAMSPVDNDKAVAFAEKYGLSAHSVRAKCTRTEGIEYARKPKTRKDGSKVETKAEIVAEIANLVGEDADRMESLANATRDVLVIIRERLSA